MAAAAAVQQCLPLSWATFMRVRRHSDIREIPSSHPEVYCLPLAGRMPQVGSLTLGYMFIYTTFFPILDMPPVQNKFFCPMSSGWIPSGNFWLIKVWSLQAAYGHPRYLRVGLREIERKSPCNPSASRVPAGASHSCLCYRVQHFRHIKRDPSKQGSTRDAKSECPSASW